MKKGEKKWKKDRAKKSSSYYTFKTKDELTNRKQSKNPTRSEDEKRIHPVKHFARKVHLCDKSWLKELSTKTCVCYIGNQKRSKLVLKLVTKAST